MPREGRDGRKWIQKVRTASTFPPPGTFARSAEAIARLMADPAVSPKGLGSAIRMVQYYINRSGRRLPEARRQELEKAKHLLQEMRRRQDADAGPGRAD